MDLLFYIGNYTANQTLIDIATAHAQTVQQDIVRKDYSTFHCCDIDPQTNKIIFQETVQGYKDWSTWTRYGFLASLLYMNPSGLTLK